MDLTTFFYTLVVILAVLTALLIWIGWRHGCKKLWEMLSIKTIPKDLFKLIKTFFRGISEMMNDWYKVRQKRDMVNAANGYRFQAATAIFNFLKFDAQSFPLRLRPFQSIIAIANALSFVKDFRNYFVWQLPIMVLPHDCDPVRDSDLVKLKNIMFEYFRLEACSFFAWDAFFTDVKRNYVVLQFRGLPENVDLSQYAQSYAQFIAERNR